MSISRLAIIFITLSLMIACETAPQQEANPPENPNNEDISQESQDDQPETEGVETSLAYQAAITEKLRAYYDALEQEEMDESLYFAPTVEAFYSQKNQNREKIGEIIRSGFEGIVERKIILDERSYQFSETENGYALEFEGFAQVRRKGDAEAKTESFRNRFVFDENYQIVEYGPALQAKNLKVDAQPHKAAAGSVKRFLDALSVLNYEEANTFIHPEVKLRYLTRPGAYDVIYTLKSLQEVTEYSPWMTEVFQGINCELELEAVPSFDCEAFDKEGCFLDKITDYDRLLVNMQALEEAELNTFTQSEMNAAAEAQQYVQVQFTHTDQTIALFFGNIDGKWYLLVLDRAIYDCSA